ncbi:MAG TPA: tripartite tricarboxylate transporter substrate binding protein [Hyphomicrobiaceae bacterium]|jgi:tripartite-type tricarboxylate transporter receptor subunit TctC|nr:tripartite tricarboxylate transporter substrate binding protein [Hyphomicrobiaceae bacterium]
MHNARAPLRMLALAGPLVIVSSIAAVGHAQDDAAQAYPTKPVHLIVGFGPGGGNDIYARLIQPKLAERLGKPVVIENKPGAGGTIAASFVAKSAPDGHTLYLGATGAMTVSPAVFSKLPYDTLRDFTPVSMIAWNPLLLAVNANAPVKSVQDLVAYARANPAKANYASSSPAFQLPTEQFKERTGTPLVGANYKSSGESLAAVVSGEVLMAIADAAPVMEQLRAGRVRALAVMSAQRFADLPDVPTMAEAGLPDMEVRLWSGVFAPAATPPAIVKKLEREMIEIIKLPEVNDRLKQLQVDPSGNTSEEFKRLIAAELPRWAAVAKAANIKLD